MEIFGGFMVMLSIFGFFLAVIWFVLPFVVIAMKGKQDRACELLERIDLRLVEIERCIAARDNAPEKAIPVENTSDSPPRESVPPTVGE